MKHALAMHVEVLTAFAVVTLFAGATAWFGIRHLRTERPAPTITVGLVLRQPTGYTWSRHSETLLLAIRVGCPHCERNMPFYRKLYSLQRSGRIPAEILAALPNSRRTIKKSDWRWLLAHPIVAGYALSKLGVVGTPTIALVGPSGKVRRLWVGELTAARAASVLAVLERGSPTRTGRVPTVARQRPSTPETVYEVSRH